MVSEVNPSTVPAGTRCYTIKPTTSSLVLRFTMRYDGDGFFFIFDQVKLGFSNKNGCCAGEDPSGK